MGSGYSDGSVQTGIHVIVRLVLNAADAQNFRIFGQTGNIEVEITGKSPNGLNVVYLVKVLSQNQTFFVFEKLKNGKRQALLSAVIPHSPSEINFCGINNVLSLLLIPG